MNDFNNLFPRVLYHSYIVEGDPQSTSLYLRKFLKERGEIKSDSPDILVEFYDSFSIDNSRKVKEWHSQMGITDGKRICIIGANFINHDAERTLLKIIEEPAINTHFFLVVPNSLVLLDTIRSRAHVVKSKTPIGLTYGSSIEKKAQEFLSLDLKNRVDFVAKFMKEKKDEDSSNIRSASIFFINEVEKIIFNKFKKNKDKNYLFILEEIEKSRDYLSLPGAGVKMILENLALVI